MQSDASRLAVQRLLCISLMLFIAGAIPFTPADGMLQPLTRGASVLAAFGVLVLAAWRSALSVTAAWRLFPLPLAAYLLWCVLSISWSLSPEVSLPRIAEGIVTFLYLQSLVIMLGQSCRSVREAAQVIAVAFIASAAIGLVINLAVFGTPFRMWVNPDVPERPRFTFGYLHPLATGDILALGIVAAAFAPWRIAGKVIMAVPLFYLLLLSDSTGARIAIVALLPLAFIVSARDALHQAWRLSGAVLVLGVGLLVAAGIGEAPLSELTRPENSRLLTLTGRTHIWAVIFDNQLASTPFGYGFEAARYVLNPLVGRAYHAHNLYLNVLVETGVIGFLIFLVLLGAWLWRVLCHGEILAWILLAYVLALGMNNPGMFTKQTIMFAFLLSYHLPALYPRRQPQRAPPPMLHQNAAA